MICKETKLAVIDNSGAKEAKCFHVYSGRKFAKIGELIRVSIIGAIPNSKIKKGAVYKAIIVHTKRKFSRKNGTNLQFGRNSVVLVDDKMMPIATRITTIVPREVSQNIRSLAEGVC